MSIEIRKVEFLLDGVSRTVTVFRDPETALRHVSDHVLDEAEGWGEVVGTALPFGEQGQISEETAVSLYDAYARAITRVLEEEPEVRLHLHVRARTGGGAWRDETNVISLDAVFVGLGADTIQTAYRSTRQRGKAKYQRFIGTLLEAELKSNRGAYENPKAGTREERRTIAACKSEWRLDRWSQPAWAAAWRRLRASAT